MRLEARNRLVMTRSLVSARRPSGSPDAYSWVWVLPLPQGGYRVAAIEIPKHLVDNDACFFEDDMATPYLKMVSRVDEVDGAVREAGANPEELAAPWHNAFPL